MGALMTGLVLTLFVLACCPAAAPLAFIAVVWAEIDQRRLERWEERQRLGELYRRIHS
jgi:hypothetical protein